MVSKGPPWKIPIRAKSRIHGQKRITCLVNSVWYFPETEGFMCAIMDQVIATNNYRKYILKDNTADTDLCSRCQKESETIQHITGACSQFVSTAYKQWHDQVGRIIHQKLAYKYGLLNKTTPYYISTGWFKIIVGVSVAYNFQTRNNKIKLLMEY
jgi:hypothetical protein